MEFFNIKSLGTSLLPSNRENCKEICGDNSNVNDNITIKEKRELDMIKKMGLYTILKINTMDGELPPD